jgi:hypothetical protein
MQDIMDEKKKCSLIRSELHYLIGQGPAYWDLN